MQLPAIPLPHARFAAGIAAGALIGVLGVGVVTAAAPPAGSPAGAPAMVPVAAPLGAAPSAAPSGQAGPDRPGLRFGALRRAVGRNFRVAIDATNRTGTRNVLYVRGTASVSGSTLTVTLPDNSTQAFTLDASTVVREKGATTTVSAITAGGRVQVFGIRNADGSYTARLVHVGGGNGAGKHANGASPQPTPAPSA